SRFCLRAEDGIRDFHVTGVQTCALPICRTNLSIQVVEEVKRFFKGQVYRSIITRNVRLSEAPSHGLPITLYDPRSKGAEAYMERSEERRVGKEDRCRRSPAPARAQHGER